MLMIFQCLLSLNRNADVILINSFQVLFICLALSVHFLVTYHFALYRCLNYIGSNGLPVSPEIILIFRIIMLSKYTSRIYLDNTVTNAFECGFSNVYYRFLTWSFSPICYYLYIIIFCLKSCFYIIYEAIGSLKIIKTKFCLGWLKATPVNQ